MYGKISRLTIKKVETTYTISKLAGGKMAEGKTNKQTHFKQFFLNGGRREGKKRKKKA